MSNALTASVSGLKAYQKMLDVAGNNLANVDTIAYKSSRVGFADLLSETVQEAGQPTEGLGGVNPQQIGSGVQVSSIDKNMSQGGLENTGRPLDMAFEGNGYFVLNDGDEDLYTRVGSFAVDSDYYLVDPATGFRVQRIGSEGLADNFQSPGDSDIRIPYDSTLDARATQQITYNGNLPAETDDPASTQVLTSGVSYAYSTSGSPAATDTLLKDLDQATSLADDDIITIPGTNPDGSTAGPVVLTVDAATSTVGDLITQINAALTGATAGVNAGGQIRIEDDTAGYSLTDITLTYAADAGNPNGDLDLPKYFEMESPGGLDSANTTVQIFDSRGTSYVLQATFVRSSSENWDMVVTKVSGDVELVDRRVKDLKFLANGRYDGLAGVNPDSASVQVRYGYNPTSTQTINVKFGTPGQSDGLTQFGDDSTVSVRDQDGYAAGYLSDLTVTREGVLMGMFSNGIRREIAALKAATFQNPAGLLAMGNSYFSVSANSGQPVTVKALSGGAGGVHGGSLEKSNVEVAEQFVNLIQAQNGYQANARTIKVANEMLRELTNLIR